MKNKLVVISGPTASGKTSLSIELAQMLDFEIINFDSLLFYKELNIGTAKPSLEERKGIPHYLIDCSTISEPLNASQFKNMATEIINKLHSQNKKILLVGGSGFYVQTLMMGMYDSPSTPEHILKKSDDVYKAEGIIPFLEILKEHDQVNYKRLHENDHYRIRRAVEHYWTHGEAFSKAMEKHVGDSPWEFLHCYLDIPKEEHFKIIQARTKKMLNDGLIEEVKELLTRFTGKEKPLQSIGYKEVIQYLNKELGRIELIDRIDISTRQLAKAQRTWFQKKECLKIHPLKDKALLVKTVADFIKN